MTGEAVEIARVLLKRMGANQVEGVLTEFASLIPGLQAGRFDIIAAGMHVTPGRCKQVQFSEPTYGVGEGFLVKPGNPLNLHSDEDILEQENVRLGVVVGAIQVDYAKSLNIPEERNIVFSDAVSALAGVQAGRADVYAATALTVADLMTKTKPDDGLERAQPFSDPIIDGSDVRGYGAYAFRNADVDFRNAFNPEIKRFIGTPAHALPVEPFGFSKEELPTGVTTEKLCAGQPREEASMEDYLSLMPALLRGGWLTIGITVGAALLAIPLALAAGLARMSRQPWVSWPAAVYVEVFRGTPALVQLF